MPNGRKIGRERILARQNIRRKNCDYFLSRKVSKKKRDAAKYDHFIINLMAMTEHNLTYRGVHAFMIHCGIKVGPDKIRKRMDYLEKCGVIEKTGRMTPQGRWGFFSEVRPVPFWRLCG